jgi:hypothetical protein
MMALSHPDLERGKPTTAADDARGHVNAMGDRRRFSSRDWRFVICTHETGLRQIKAILPAKHIVSKKCQINTKR